MSASCDWVAPAVDLVSALAWPAVALTFLLLFRPSIASVVERLTDIGVGGGAFSAKFGSRPEDGPAKFTDLDLSDAIEQVPVDEIEREITDVRVERPAPAKSASRPVSEPAQVAKILQDLFGREIAVRPGGGEFGSRPEDGPADITDLDLSGVIEVDEVGGPSAD